jgi:predicted secreted hydrolase
VDAGIRFKVLWWDDAVQEIRVSASNGVFAGEADAYVSHGALSKLATDLSGFPLRASDVRVFQFGSPEGAYAGGFIQLTFSCTDPAGHAGIDVVLEAGPAAKSGSGRESASRFHVKVEAAGIDVLVRQLSQLDKNRNGTATCPMTA